MRFGLCCISLELKEIDPDIRFQTMTYKRFSSLDRQDALCTLGERILNNMEVTNATILYCAEHNYCYRISSDLFPLITYDLANVTLTDLPQYSDIMGEIDNIHTLFNKIASQFLVILQNLTYLPLLINKQ